MQSSAECARQRGRENRSLTRLFWTVLGISMLYVGCDSAAEAKTHRIPTSFGGLVTLVQEAQDAGQASGVRVGSVETEPGITATVLWFNSEAATVFGEFKLEPISITTVGECEFGAGERIIESNARQIVVVDNTQTANGIGNPGVGQPDASDMYAFGVCVSDLSR